MGRGLAARPRACVDHPHRPAVDRCDECFRRYCRECFVRAGVRLLCRECSAAAPAHAALAAQQRRLSFRLRHGLWERRGGLVAAGLVLGSLAAAAFLAVWGGDSERSGSAGALADGPALLQRIAAGRYCAGGGGVAREPPRSGGTVGAAGAGAGNPAVRAETGALIAAVAGVLPDSRPLESGLGATAVVGGANPRDPMNLVRQRAAVSSGWRSGAGAFPQQVGYELRGTASVDRAAFRHTLAAPSDSWANEVGLLLSTEGPDTGFYTVGRWTLARTTEPQEFRFWATPARYVRVCIYSNYGNRDSVSLGAFALGLVTDEFQAVHAPLLAR
jgi:hypothetical protein